MLLIAFQFPHAAQRRQIDPALTLIRGDIQFCRKADTAHGGRLTESGNQLPTAVALLADKAQNTLAFSIVFTGCQIDFCDRGREMPHNRIYFLHNLFACLRLGGGRYQNKKGK